VGLPNRRTHVSKATTRGVFGMELSSVYVGVEDMERALDFYRELFGMEPAEADERFSTFAFDGADFGLYRAGHDGFELDFGNSCVPNFEVDDVDAAYDRIARFAPEMVHDEVVAFGDYRTFHVVDTEGNELEVFSIDDG